MSYKYLYAYTDEISLDLSNAKYIGKQDRANPELIRATEHTSKQDKQCEHFCKIKYLLISIVPNGESTSDYEAYLIQKFNPPLNKVYTNKRITKKLNKEEFKEIEKRIEKLEWFLIRNSPYSEIYPNVEKKIIDTYKQTLAKATYIFKDEEEFNNTSLSKIKEKLLKGRIFIEPELRATNVVNIIEITNKNNEDYLVLKDLRNESETNTKDEKIVNYAKNLIKTQIPELGATIWRITLATRDKANEEFHKVHDPGLETIFYMWFYLLLKAISQLEAVEPDLVHNAKVEDFDKDLYKISLIGEGFNYRNLEKVIQIKNICDTDKLTYGKHIHLKELLSEYEDYIEVRDCSLEELYKYNAKSENDIKEILQEEASFVFDDEYLYSELIHS